MAGGGHGGREDGDEGGKGEDRRRGGGRVLPGSADGAAGFRRLDVAISRASDGGLRVEVTVLGKLVPAVASLLAALGVKAGR